MHIKTEPCPDAGTRESYHVIVCEDDSEETPVNVLGHITRADDGANSWTLRLMHPGDDSGPITFEAASLDEVRKAMEKQFTHVKISANRLGLGVMSRFVDDLMDPVIELAEQTGSVSALVHGLVHIMARVVAIRIPEPQHEGLLELIVANLKRDVKGFTDQRAQQQQLAQDLKKKFAKALSGESLVDLLRSDDDEETPKH